MTAISSLVLTALEADTVRKLALVAVGALGGADRGKKVVAASLGSALLGMAAFRIRHCGSLSNGRHSGMSRAAWCGLTVRRSCSSWT